MKSKQNRPEWKRILFRSVISPSDLSMGMGEDKERLKEVVARYPMRINPYYLSLIKERNDPIYRQCIPDMKELSNNAGYEDPLNEEGFSPTNGLTHKYPDRVLFLVSGRCAVYCRFCNRKRKVGKPGMVTRETIKNGIGYIRKHREIRDVLLSGGDPLLLENGQLDYILREIRSIPHVEIIRIGTRVPCTLPHRVTPRLAGILKKYHPLYIHTHFNHPSEVTEEAAK